MPRNIPYIHNYCDRWCERCPQTDRCAVFEMNKDLSPEAQDPGQEAFWDLIGQRFSQTLQALQEEAARWDIAIVPPTEEAQQVMEQEEAAIGAQLEASPLLRAAQHYADGLEGLFTRSTLWEEKGRRLAEETRLGIKSVEKGLTEVDLLKDCRDVLAWYQYFIYSKFNRALRGLLEDGDEALEPQSDMHGSACIALVAVERSRLALTTLLGLAGEDDDLLALLALLERIEKEGRATFPGAAHFRRPGFDGSDLEDRP